MFWKGLLYSGSALSPMQHPKHLAGSRKLINCIIQRERQSWVSAQDLRAKKCTCPQRSPPALLRGVPFSCPAPANFWILIWKLAAARIGPCWSLLFTSSLDLADGNIIRFYCNFNSDDLFTSDTKKLPLCRGLRKFTSSGRVSRHPESLTLCHLARRNVPVLLPFEAGKLHGALPPFLSASLLPYSAPGSHGRQYCD